MTVPPAERALMRRAGGSFRAPLVPFAPAMALLFNFFLMAQYNAQTHSYLGGLIGLAVAGYAWTKSSSHYDAAAATGQRHRH